MADGGGKIDGTLLNVEQKRRLTQQQAENAQSVVRAQILDRLIEAYPREAPQVRLAQMNVSSNNPNTLVADMKMSFKPGFAQTVVGTVEALSKLRCENQPMSAFPAAVSFDESPSFSIARYRVDEIDCSQWSRSQKHLRSNILHDTICNEVSSSLRCYALEKGNYCVDCTLSGKRLAIYGRFVDTKGESAMAGGKCFVGAFPNFARQGSVPFFGRRGGVNGAVFVAGFNLADEPFSLTFNSSDIDLSRASYFVAVALLVYQSGFSNQFKPVGVMRQSKPVDGCETVDEAVRRYKFLL